MILRKIELQPFAGSRERMIELKPGINVIVGPNDIGKSTLFRAIDCGFFLRTHLRRNTNEGKAAETLIPIGGDHARVALEWEKEGQRYRLEKTWGPQPSSRLRLPDGNLLTAEERVEETLLKLLPVTAATFRSALMARQGALEKTLEQLKGSEALHSLGDLLRATLSRTDGVSVDRLKSTIDERYKEAFDRWNPETGLPEKDRGLENPWKNPGKILEAYYTRERLRRRHAEAVQLESEFGEKTRLLSEKQTLLQSVQEFVQKNEKLVEALSERQKLEAELREIERELKRVSEDFGAWVQSDAERKLLEPEVTRLQTLAESLSKELEASRAEASRQALLSRFGKIREKKEEFDRLNQALASTPALPRAALTEIRQLQGRIETLRAGQSAGKLKLSIVPRGDLQVRIKTGLSSDENVRDLGAGSALELEAPGRIEIGSELFDLRVTSGDGKFEALEAELSKTAQALATLLDRHGVKNLEEAQARAETYEASTQAARAAGSMLTELLSGESYENLLEKFSAAESARAARDPKLVLADFQSTNEHLGQARGKLTQIQKTLADIGRRYQVTDASKFALLIGQKTQEQAQHQAKIAALPPIPTEAAESGNLESFVLKYRESRSRLPQISAEVRDLAVAREAIAQRLFDESSQEIERQLRHAVAAFERELRTGKALAKIRSTITSIESSGEDIYRDLRDRFVELATKTSAGKYVAARMDGSLPIDFRRQDGTPIPFSMLSSGTKDGMALSLRLAMARHFLHGARGFLIMDDPMVAMDEGRRKAVAELLRDFATETQLIILTCHPEHAALLTDSPIELRAEMA